MTVQLGHPDAVAAMLNPSGEIDSHFAAPPFFADELKRVPGAHVVTTSADILGHKASQALLFARRDGDAGMVPRTGPGPGRGTVGTWRDAY